MPAISTNQPEVAPLHAPAHLRSALIGLMFRSCPGMTLQAAGFHVDQFMKQFPEVVMLKEGK